MAFELHLPTMTCGHCVKVVTQTVQAIDPAATLTVDLPAHAVSIESTHSEQVFRDALSAEGYAASAA
jgi:copper chaperone